MYQKQHPSLGFQLHLYKFFILLSVYFYRRQCDSIMCTEGRKCFTYTHTDIYASLISCTELPISCIRTKHPSVDKVACTTKKVGRPASSGRSGRGGDLEL